MKIKELRLASGLSQLELANKMHVNQTAISQWERDVALPTADKIPALADALGCTIGALFGREPA